MQPVLNFYCCVCRTRSRLPKKLCCERYSDKPKDFLKNSWLHFKKSHWLYLNIKRWIKTPGSELILCFISSDLCLSWRALALKSPLHILGSPPPEFKPQTISSSLHNTWGLIPQWSHFLGNCICLECARSHRLHGCYSSSTSIYTL